MSSNRKSLKRFLPKLSRTLNTIFPLKKNYSKYTLIIFWASWCPPCVREIPDFVRLHEAYNDKGFEIIGIALDEEQAVIDFIDPIGVDYPILIATNSGIALTQAYGNRLGILPFSVIVDRKGNIVSSHRSELSFERVEQIIKPLL